MSPRRFRLCALGALALVAAAPVLAQDRSSQPEQLKDLRPHVADPSSGYIWVRGNSRVSLVLIREPTDADRAVVERERQEAFARATQRFDRDTRRYADDVAAYRANPRLPRPQVPVRPTLESASAQVRDAAIRNVVQISPSPPYRKDRDAGAEGEWGYLVRAPAGRYIIVGPMTWQPVTSGACFCMGTLAFDVAPGVVTDMGRLVGGAPADAFDNDGMAMNFVSSTIALPDQARAGMTVVPARYRAHGALPNFFAVEVNRIAPIPGVLAYGPRGQVLDAADGNRELPPADFD